MGVGYKLSSWEDGYDIPSYGMNTTDTKPSADFVIQSCEYFEPYTLLDIVYEEASNYGGRKLLVYLGDVTKTLLNSNHIDPHFLEGGLAPLIRIRPSQAGLKIFNSLKNNAR